MGFDFLRHYGTIMQKGGSCVITQENIHGLTLLQSSEEFKLTRDAVALAEFAAVHPGHRVCDLGCGVGNLLILLAGRCSALTLDGIEVREGAAALCRQNLACNGLPGRIITGDLTGEHDLPRGGYHLVVANPPYFPPGSGYVSPKEAKATARTEENYTLAAACGAAGRLCRYGGRFALCLRPERLGELFASLAAAGLEPKRLQLVQTGTEKEANLALVEAIKGAKPGLRVLPVKIER